MRMADLNTGHALPYQTGSAADLFAPDLVLMDRPIHTFAVPSFAENSASRLAASPQFDKMLAAADRSSFASTVASLHGRSPVGSPLGPPPGGWRAGRPRGGHRRASAPGEPAALPLTLPPPTLTLALTLNPSPSPDPNPN